MAFQCKAPEPDKPQKLDVLFAPEGDAFRIYVWPTWLPSHLSACLDENGEAYPVYVDIDDLDRRMVAAGTKYEKREIPGGGFGLVAEGPAAAVLMHFLSRMFESGSRSLFG